MEIKMAIQDEVWEYELADPNETCIEREFTHIGPIGGSGQICVDSVFCTIEQANVAVAAPELLKALELIHDHARLYIPQYGPNQNVFDAVTAAINKAKGLTA
jgi:hypothetical protein